MSAAVAATNFDERASVDKAIALLEAFGPDASTGVGVSELARRSQLSKSTAHRVLGTLVRNGVVERVGSDYRLGARLLELGRTVYPPDHDAIRDQLIPSLTELYEATRETVHLAALHGRDVVYLAKLYGHRRVASPSRIGGTVPAHATAVGKAMLAYDPDSLALVLEAPLRRLTPRTVIDHNELLEQLDEVRRAGLAFERGESMDGLHCLAAPIKGPNRRAVAALSIAAGEGKLDFAEHGAILRRVASTANHIIRRRIGAERARGTRSDQ